MTRSGLTVVPGERLVDAPLSWEALLRASVRPAFQVDAYLARPGDPGVVAVLSQRPGEAAR